MKKSILISLAALLLAAGTCCVAVYAWFVQGVSVFNMQFSIAVVDMRLALYRVNDFDLDGFPDRNEQGNWSFSEQPIFDTEKANSDADIDAAMKNGAKIENFMPSQVYTYRLDIYNSGDVDSFLSLSAQNLNDSLSYRAFYFGADGKQVDVTVTDAATKADLNDPTLVFAPVPLKADNSVSLQLYIQVKCEKADKTLNGKAEMTFTILA